MVHFPHTLLLVLIHLSIFQTENLVDDQLTSIDDKDNDRDLKKNRKNEDSNEFFDNVGYQSTTEPSNEVVYFKYVDETEETMNLDENINKDIDKLNGLKQQIDYSNDTLTTISSIPKTKISNKCFCNITEITLSSQFAKLKGPKGDRGSIGERGLPGLPGIGEKGEKGEKGHRGAIGHSGPKGEPGKDGLPGLQGARGPPGPPGLSSPIVQPSSYDDWTGGYFYQSSIGAPGPPGKPGLPGIRGEKGAVGEKGLKGSMGHKGEKGETGSRGWKGYKGDTGKTGHSGPIGPKGQSGMKGEKGERGECQISESLVNKFDIEEREEMSKYSYSILGPKGDKGDKGDSGIDGPKGDKGIVGERGNQGLPGEKGELGEKGMKGDSGPPGSPGAFFGNKKFTIVKGEKGEHGRRGKKGYQGHSGKDGAPGLPGPPGPPGPPGLSILQGSLDNQELNSEAKFAKEPGVMGPPGPSGFIKSFGQVNGIVGLPGLPGPPGPPGKGIQGPPGPIGSRGFQGLPGPPGPTGESCVCENNEKTRKSETKEPNLEYKDISSLKQTSNIHQPGTLAFVSEEESLLLRVNNGWKYVSLGVLIKSHNNITNGPLLSLDENQFVSTSIDETSMKRQKKLRLVALNQPYNGDLHGIRGADYECFRQSRRYKVEGTYRAFLASRVQNLDSIVNHYDSRLPLINTKGEILFNSWQELFTGSGAQFNFQPRIYSFDGKNILTDNTWPEKIIWHGSNKRGIRDVDSYCDAWHSDQIHKFGSGSSLLNGKLLNEEKYPCNKPLIVLCIQVTS